MLKKAFILLIIICSYFAAIAQASFHIEHYTSHNGLPENSVRSMAFDENGFLWLSTEGGLVRFDGISFRVFNAATNPDFREDRVTEIFKTMNGEIFFTNNYGGIFSIKNNTITTLQKNAPLNVHYLRVWGNVPSLELYKNFLNSNTAQKYDWFLGESSGFVFSFTNKEFAVADKNGAYIYSDTTLNRFIPTARYEPSGYLLLNGNLLFFNTHGHLFRIDVSTGKVDPCQFTGDLHPGDFSSVQLANMNTLTDFSSGEAFINMSSRLYEIRMSADSFSFTTSLITDELPGNCIITSVIHYKKGDIYFLGTDTKGLYVFKKEFLKTISYSPLEEGTNNSYYSQAVLDSGSVITGYGREFDIHGSKTNLTPIKAYQPGTILEDGEDLWYNMHDSLSCYNMQSKITKSISSLSFGFLTVLYKCNGVLWAAFLNGIATVEKDSIQLRLPFSEKVNPGRIFCFYETPDKILWAGTGNGILQFNTLNNQVDTEKFLTGTVVRSIMPINDMICIGTYGNGFYLWKNGRLVKPPLDRQGYLSYVHTFMNDGQGFVWMTTNRGLFKTTISSLENLFADSTATVYYYRYGEEDGLTSEEFNGGCSPAFVKLPNGYYSFPNMEGLVWMKPNEVPTLLPDQNILVDKIVTDGVRQSSLSDLHLDCDNRNTEISVSTPFWGDAANLWMDYEIAGYHSRWIPLGNGEQKISFANLPPGNYKLQIRKYSGFGQNQISTFTLPIEVESHYYQTWWFILSSCLLLLFLFWIILRLYVNAIRQRNKRLELLVHDRTEEIRSANLSLADSQKSLQQDVLVKDKLISIISHDIITPLRFIGFSAKMATQQEFNDTAKLIYTLADIQNAAGKLHDNALNILNWINYQNNHIEVKPTNVATFALVEEIFEQVREMAAAKSNRLINTISEDDILITDQQLLAIVLHNIISNAIKHTRNGIIIFAAEQEEGHYQISITDNGNGMNEEILQRINNPSPDQVLNKLNSDKDYGGSGLGYIIVNELLELLHSSYRVKSDEGKGTSVVITLPALK